MDTRGTLEVAFSATVRDGRLRFGISVYWLLLSARRSSVYGLSPFCVLSRLLRTRAAAASGDPQSLGQ